MECLDEKRAKEVELIVKRANAIPRKTAPRMSRIMSAPAVSLTSAEV